MALRRFGLSHVVGLPLLFVLLPRSKHRIPLDPVLLLRLLGPSKGSAGVTGTLRISKKRSLSTTPPAGVQHCQADCSRVIP